LRTEPDNRSGSDGAPERSSTERQGLAAGDARLRLERYGPNALPEAAPLSVVALFLRQFLSPLIYVLLAAAVVSLALGEVRDATFILIVLVANGLVGTVQEYSAGHAAAALRKLENPLATVVRDGQRQTVPARDLVPGDFVLLEAGGRVAADIRLTEAEDLRCDESLLTGEPNALTKHATSDHSPPSHGDMAFAGTMVTRGRGAGIVAATGLATEVGKIAREIAKRSTAQPPLVIRMERLARTIAVATGVAILIVAGIGLLRGLGLSELFALSVGLAVSAIPEGLPVAISVALAIGMRRMSKAGVIVRKMAAAEALGSCTMIATDKTGTMTLNALTVTDIVLVDGTRLICETGEDIDACRIVSPHLDNTEARGRAARLLLAAALPNEGDLRSSEGRWIGQGDSVDVALLGAARKGGLVQDDLRTDFTLLSRIPYEPDRKYAASLHRMGNRMGLFAKGAPETLIEMCDRMDVGGKAVPIDRDLLLAQRNELAARGLRVLAFADGDLEEVPANGFNHGHLINLTFRGLVGMHDPLRREVPTAIRDCRRAGIAVAMITGDDPRTAASIAAHAGLAFAPDQVVTGDDLRLAEAQGEAALDTLTRDARIYARIDPAQKLAIVRSLARNGHFVAMTGDGINDAPALRHAHVGVAMGLKGTEVAKESADIVITDDNFASIVKGVAEGRVAYANIRKVVYMLVSTGAAEIALFLLALAFGLPMPLTAVQLLWLNLVTNGLQDVALAAEKAEGDELTRPPRRPNEPIFDSMMIRRIINSTLVMGGGGFAVFYVLLQWGFPEDQARSLLLLLFVLFENFQTLNSRSERRSVFAQSFSSNPWLIVTVFAAHGLHIAATYTPWLGETLALTPFSLLEWIILVGIAASVLVVGEIDKHLTRRIAAGPV
jgi:Ca2+-transporting ATPase